MKTKFLLLSVIYTLLVLSGCVSEQSTDNEEQPIMEVQKKQPVTTVENETDNSSPLVPITQDIAHKKYALDPDIEQYPEGIVQFNDGTLAKIEWYSYKDGETFDYAMAKFLLGELVQVQLDLKDGVTKSQVLAELGLPEEIRYDANGFTNVVDVVVDDRFADDNIAKLPNEWD